MPPPSTSRGCLLPARPRSTGLGPVLAPLFLPADGWSRRSRAPIPTDRTRAARRAAARAAAPTLRPAARREAADRLAAWIAETPLPHRQQRLDPLPQPVRHLPRLRAHRHPPELDDGCRRTSPPRNGFLH